MAEDPHDNELYSAMSEQMAAAAGMPPYDNDKTPQRPKVKRVLTTRISAQEAVAALMKNQGLKEF